MGKFNNEEIEKKFKKMAEKLDLEYKTEDSIKLEKKTLNSNRKCYFLINKKDKNKINDNLEYIKKTLKIKKLPQQYKNDTVNEFVYGVDFKEKIIKIYFITDFYRDDAENAVVNNSIEFYKNETFTRKYYGKNMKFDIFNRYKLLKPYNDFFYYKNYYSYYIRKKDENVDQVGLLYHDQIKLEYFIDLFIKICDTLKWEKKELVKLLEKNKNKILNIITFGKDYITIYYYDI